jgi:hypothetical protein
VLLFGSVVVHHRGATTHKEGPIPGLWMSAAGIAESGQAASMALEPWDIKDPDLLIRAVAELVPLAEDTAYVVLVRRPSTQQEIVEIRKLDLPALLDDDDDISDELRDAVRSFGVPDTRECLHAVVTVLVRPGLCVMGPNEAVWLKGWRYANHFVRAFDGDLILVTEHGWTDFMTRFAGHAPRMESACRSHAAGVP